MGHPRRLRSRGSPLCAGRRQALRAATGKLIPRGSPTPRPSRALHRPWFGAERLGLLPPAPPMIGPSSLVIGPFHQVTLGAAEGGGPEPQHQL